MHSYEEYQKATQQVINLMKDDYPNGFDMRINKFGAELVNNQTVATYIDENIMENYCCVDPVTAGNIFEKMFKSNNSEEN